MNNETMSMMIKIIPVMKFVKIEPPMPMRQNNAPTKARSGTLTNIAATEKISASNTKIHKFIVVNNCSPCVVVFGNVVAVASETVVELSVTEITCSSL
jgi:hypothetical protein